MITEQMIPMIIVPTTFLFVLLIILIAKAPKAGAWIVGGLIFMLPILLYRVSMSGALAHEEAIPVVVVPVTFLFVLLVVLLAKAPKVGTGLIVAIVVMAMLSLFLWPRALRRMAAGDQVTKVATISRVEQPWTEDAEARMAVVKESNRVLESYVQAPPVAAESPTAAPIPPEPSTPTAPSPIWAEGVEREFEAGIYPSVLAAARALGRRTVQPIRTVIDDPNAVVKVILFQEGNERGIVSAFGQALENELPGVQYSLEADLRNIHPGEVGLTLRREGTIQEERRHNEGTGLTIVQPVEGGRIVATAYTESRRASAETDYIDKPWIENFASFANTRPSEHFIVVRSNGTCTSEAEANQQVLDDARARLTEAVGKHGRLPVPAITATDVLNGGFVVDQFAQSFDGSAAKIWRKAMLIDVSGSKLAQLSSQKTHESREMRMTWARMGFSVIGVTVLIGVIYFFLNMATMGYYEWSLRIAGVVLAIVAVISVLMVVR
jgi:hypothetical protein